MYLVQIDTEGEIAKIGKQLGSLHDKAPNVLASALNSTRTKSTTLIKNAIRKRYAYQRKDKLKNAFSYRRATKQHLDTTIFIASEVQHLSDFKISPTSPSNSDYGAAKAQVMKNGGIKPIEGDGVKAFIAKFASGKVAIVRRVPGQRYKTSGALNARLAKYGKSADSTRIKALLGPSIPKMAATVHKEEGIDEETRKLLQANIQKQIAKTIEKAMKG